MPSTGSATSWPERSPRRVGGIPPVVDRLVAAILLVALAPVLVLVAIAVRLSSPGPVLHRASRVGLGGTNFEVLKFRSMRLGEPGTAVTSANDPRVTGVGRAIRSLKLDELPQLLNVVKGDMALVGPRPEDPRYVALYTDEQRRLLRVRPGVTSPATVRYRHEESILAAATDVEQTYITEVLPAKLAIDLEWLDRRTLATDVQVLVATLLATLRTR